MQRPSVYAYTITDPPGVNVYRLRITLGLSQRDLAKKCRPTIEHTTIRRLENNLGFTQDTLERVAKALGVPYAPITANMLLFGPLGLVAYFPAKFKLKVLDPVHFDVPPDQERYSKSKVMEAADDIRQRIQDLVDQLAPPIQDEPFLDRVRRLNAARQMAMEVALDEYLPTPGSTQDETSDWTPLMPDLSDLL